MVGPTRKDQAGDFTPRIGRPPQPAGHGTATWAGAKGPAPNTPISAHGQPREKARKNHLEPRSWTTTAGRGENTPHTRTPMPGALPGQRTGTEGGSRIGNLDPHPIAPSDAGLWALHITLRVAEPEARARHLRPPANAVNGRGLGETTSAARSGSRQRGVNRSALHHAPANHTIPPQLVRRNRFLATPSPWPQSLTTPLTLPRSNDLAPSHPQPRSTRLPPPKVVDLSKASGGWDGQNGQPPLKTTLPHPE